MNYDCTLPHRKYFYEIAQYPHGSGNEKALSDYIVRFAREHGLKYKQDSLHNVIIYKDASVGYENAAPLGIQAHMDMVCEKNKNTVHDFTKDPLQLVVTEDGLLRANGTTLGADDCTGVAYMMSILADDTLAHPALECIFTTQEEVGLVGAMALKAEDLCSRRIINLDGGGEYTTLITSAGGCRTRVKKTMQLEKNSNPCYTVSVRGLLGGHSGGEIHMEKGNANKIMARILKELQLKGISYRLCNLNGGLKENAIPRECDAVLATAVGAEALEQAVSDSAKIIRKELEFSDPGLKACVTPAEACPEACSEQDTRDAVDMMFLIPNGFMARSMAVEGLTMTSLNMGIVSMEDKVLNIAVSMRSMLASCIDNLYNQVALLCKVFGAEVSRGAQYPGWNYCPKSALRDIMGEAVRDLFGAQLKTVSTHGGTECGILSALHEDMDIISMGPVTRYIHTPDEELDLASFDSTYTLLTEIVSRCK